jgi:hypothetical protein
MPETHGIHGKGGTISGPTFAGKLDQWEYSPKTETLDDTACGDTYKSRLASFNDWEITAEFLVTSGTALGAQMGTEFAISLANSSAAGIGTITRTGILTEMKLTNKSSEAMRGSLKMECSQGDDGGL